MIGSHLQPCVFRSHNPLKLPHSFILVGIRRYYVLCCVVTSRRARAQSGATLPRFSGDPGREVTEQRTAGRGGLVRLSEPRPPSLSEISSNINSSLQFSDFRITSDLGVVFWSKALRRVANLVNSTLRCASRT